MPLAFVVVFVGGLGIGKYTGRPIVVAAPTNKVLREGGYKYINPVLLCNTNTDREDNKDKTLIEKLTTYINQAPEKNVSVYYLTLTKGKWAGINESQTYSPASMLKVPTMVAILKYIESHEDILSKEVFYDGKFDDNTAEYFKPRQALQSGHSYSVDQLLTYMIAYSDNNATRLLHDTVDSRSLENIYINLGIQIPTEMSDFMSPKTYALFLRLLYNSTYLTREMSEKALHLMDASDFPQGLSAGVPSSVQVANKFGEREVVNTDGTVQERELHDCGIVYATDNPYVLCIMTQGNDFDALATEIRSISKLVYERVTQ